MGGRALGKTFRADRGHRRDIARRRRFRGLAPPLLKIRPSNSEEKEMTDDGLLAAFFEEAEELLASFEAGLLQLETRADDAELLNGIFRSAHTLKGNSAMLGFDEVARVTHGLEDLLDRLRKGELDVSARVIDALLYAKDVVRQLLT